MGHEPLQLTSNKLLAAVDVVGAASKAATLSAWSSPARFEPHASAAADDNDSLPDEFRFEPEGKGCCCNAHNSSRNP
jgi:hypothetical protein